MIPADIAEIVDTAIAEDRRLFAPLYGECYWYGCRNPLYLPDERVRRTRDGKTFCTDACRRRWQRIERLTRL